MTRTRLLASLAVTLGLAFGTAACSVEEEGGSGGAGKRDANAQRDNGKGGKSVKQKPAEPEMTSGQENALEAAQNYVDMMPFSKAGLIQQLSSPAGDGYSKADATFAANHVDADWNAEAVEAAKNYLDMMPMSENELFEQLTSSAGDKFTPAQARYAVDKTY